MELTDLGRGILLHVRRLLGKGRNHTFLGLTLPTGDLPRIHVILAGQRGQGQLARQGLERHFGLKLRRKLPSLGHRKSSTIVEDYSLAGCPIFRDHFRLPDRTLLIILLLHFRERQRSQDRSCLRMKRYAGKYAIATSQFDPDLYHGGRPWMGLDILTFQIFTRSCIGSRTQNNFICYQCAL